MPLQHEQSPALQAVAQQNRQELEKLLSLVCCLGGPKATKERYWIELFKFMHRVMPADMADCCLELLTEDAFTALTYADQVRGQKQINGVHACHVTGCEQPGI